MEVTQSTLPAQGWSSACLERGVVTWGLCSLVPSGLWAMDSMCNLCFFVLTDIASREKTSISVLKTRLQVTQLTKVLWFSGKIRKRTQKLPETFSQRSRLSLEAT